MEVFDMLKSMNISAIDFQIRSLSLSAFYPFLEMLLKILEHHKDFELVQTYLASFLNIHNEILWSYNYVKLESDDSHVDNNVSKDSLTEVNN